MDPLLAGWVQVEHGLSVTGTVSGAVKPAVITHAEPLRQALALTSCGRLQQTRLHVLVGPCQDPPPPPGLSIHELHHTLGHSSRVLETEVMLAHCGTARRFSGVLLFLPTGRVCLSIAVSYTHLTLPTKRIV
eukprot:TRINITY_DN19931_c0_g1_i7.p1 TRINITY_DN19931_c0_g1~~TRINITY_DN19931_c0_g1_i7.p1  ORF type:complete len:132 (+),score=20.40 TRINITY_DN19931_c0_g1_i7:409-804(+)